jgi:hypothetical protein
MKFPRFALAAVVASVFALAGCSKIIYAPQYQTGSVTHVVLFSLKDKADSPATLQKFKAAALEMRKIAGVYDIEVGPATTAVGGSGDFDIGLTVFFRDEASLRAYKTDPIHQRLSNDVFKPASAKITVYHFTNQEYQ